MLPLKVYDPASPRKLLPAECGPCIWLKVRHFDRDVEQLCPALCDSQLQIGILSRCIRKRLVETTNVQQYLPAIRHVVGTPRRAVESPYPFFIAGPILIQSDAALKLCQEIVAQYVRRRFQITSHAGDLRVASVTTGYHAEPIGRRQTIIVCEGNDLTHRGRYTVIARGRRPLVGLSQIDEPGECLTHLRCPVSGPIIHDDDLCWAGVVLSYE